MTNHIEPTELDETLEMIVRFYVSDEDLRQELLHDLTHLINKSYISRKAVEEAIGEDEPEEVDKWTPEMDSYIRQARQVVYGRNALRADIKKRLLEDV